MKIVQLNADQLETLENKLSEYDDGFIPDSLEGSVQIGIEENGRIVAGLDACITTFKILYVSTVL